MVRVEESVKSGKRTWQCITREREGARELALGLVVEGNRPESGKRKVSGSLIDLLCWRCLRTWAWTQVCMSLTLLLRAQSSKSPFYLPSSKSAPGEQDASLAGPHLQPTPGLMPSPTLNENKRCLHIMHFTCVSLNLHRPLSKAMSCPLYRWGSLRI